MDRLGLIAAAGELATEWGLTGWKAGTASEAAHTVLALWFEGRGGAGPAEARDAVKRVRAFLSAHGGSRFETGAGTGQKVHNRAGWRDPDREWFYIARDVWADEVHAGSDPTRAARHLADAGLLERDGRHLAVKAPRDVPGRPRAYKVSAKILDADDDGRVPEAAGSADNEDGGGADE